MPSEASARSSAGAAAFVSYFIEVLNYAQRTGDTSKLEELSIKACAGCSGYVKAIRKTYDGGGRVVGGEISIGNIRELPKDYGADWGGFTHGTATSQTIIDGTGDSKSYPGGKFALYAYATWSGGRWGMQWIRTPA